MSTCPLPNIALQALEQASDGVLIIDSSNQVLLFNRAAQMLWGVSADSVLGHHAGVLFNRGRQDLNADAPSLPTSDALSEQLANTSSLHIVRSDGTSRWLSVSHSSLQNAGQSFCVAFFRDVTVELLHDKQLLSMVVEHTDNAIMILDDQWCTLYVNSGFTRLFGYSAEQTKHATPTSLLAPYLTAEQVAGIRQQLDAGTAITGEDLAYCANGQRLWCHVTLSPVFDTSGAMCNAIVVLTDITYSKIHEVLQNRILSAMAREGSLESVMTIACTEIERIAPEITASILRVTDQGTLTALAGPSLPERYIQAINGTSIGPLVGSCGSSAFLGEEVLVEDIATDLRWRNLKHLALDNGLHSCWSTPIIDSCGKVLGTFAFYYTEKRGPSAMHRRLMEALTPLCSMALQRDHSRAQIRQLAFYDTLTQLPNRSLLHAKAEQALAEADRSSSPLCVVFIDLDRFKQINDSLGHRAGDELLCTIAQRLASNRRACDIVGRLSGDEFVMVLPQCGAAQITEIIEQIQSDISGDCEVTGMTLRPSASIGISLYPHDGRDMATLIQRADMAMYQAKTNGRGCYSYYSHDLDSQAQERLNLERALRDAINQGHLRLVYQPQMGMQDDLLYGVEALTRWTHPELGEISPTRFIPLAEECGLINALSAWAVSEACQQLAAWRAQGLQIPAVAVNLSPTNFHNLELPQFIASTLERNRLAPSDLTLEITENLLLDTNPSTMSTLKAVRQHGVRLSMDDFGSGYSSLSYLRHLPIQELKLDRSFVADLANDPTNQALSEAVIRLGESLQLTVIAEGVETVVQRDILKQQGYHVAQGYLFSKPMPAAELALWVHALDQSIHS